MRKNKESAARQFRKHLHYSYKLKEGSKAWEREMRLCEHFMRIVRA